MCRINFMHQTLLCEASKKKATKSRDILLRLASSECIDEWNRD
jgi:hypothetical protein